MNATGALVRLVLRRDRARIPIWTLSLTALVLVSAVSIRDLYPDPAELATYAATVEGNPALVALSGPAHALDTMGGRIAWEVWVFGVAVALMALLAVVRHTRLEEENGRTELVRATVVGRHAHSAAALAVVAATCTLVGGLVALGLAALDLPLAGSLTLGASFTAVGLVFAGVGLLAAQVVGHARAATGLGGGLLGLAFLLRAVGDVGTGALSWLSPLGWMQATQPYAGDRWWPLLLSVAAAAVTVAVALRLADHRDVGAGLIATRPGPASAGPRLRSELGLAWRLQRGSVLGWSVGLFIGGGAMGSVAHTADELVGDNEQIRDYLAQIGGADLTDIFLASVLAYLALVAGGFALQSATRLRSEETAGRAEPILGAAVSRRSWSGSHLAVCFGGSVVALAAGGLGIGAAHAVAVGEPGQVPRLVAAALAFLPAVWCLAALAAALFGCAPRALPLVWAALAFCVVVSLLGQVLGLPEAVRELSPFQHVAQVPAVAPGVATLALTTAVAAALVAVGQRGIARRDLTTT